MHVRYEKEHETGEKYLKLVRNKINEQQQQQNLKSWQVSGLKFTLPLKFSVCKRIPKLLSDFHYQMSANATDFHNFASCEYLCMQHA